MIFTCSSINRTPELSLLKPNSSKNKMHPWKSNFRTIPKHKSKRIPAKVNLSIHLNVTLSTYYGPPSRTLHFSVQHRSATSKSTMPHPTYPKKQTLHLRSAPAQHLSSNSQLNLASQPHAFPGRAYRLPRAPAKGAHSPP